LETENGYRLDFRVCKDQLIICYQDRADDTIMFELENVPKSQEEFDAFWQEHRSMAMIEGLESGEDKPLEYDMNGRGDLLEPGEYPF